MASASPLTALILATGRGTAGDPEKPTKTQELLALATARPELLAQPLNSMAPELPLDGALYWGRLPAAKALTAAAAANGVTLRTVGGAPLVQAAHSCNPDLVEWVWDSGLDRTLGPEVGEAAVTIKGPEDERVQVVRLLLAKGVPVSDTMAFSAVTANPKVASVLVTAGILTAARMAALEPRLSSPLQNPLGFTLLPGGGNALFVAVGSGSVDAVRAALAAGSPVNGTLPGAALLGTPLHFALLRGDTAVAAALLAAGADPTALAASGQSIVGAAVRSGKVTAVLAAVAAAPTPALVNAVERRVVPSRDATPLVAAVLLGVPNVVDIVRALLAAGADPTTLATAGVPAAYWPVYFCGVTNGLTTADAAAVLLALAAGNPQGQRADLDAVSPTVRQSPRAFARTKGIPI
jgi:hypothetical protein